jgi:hypothetical protein
MNADLIITCPWCAHGYSEEDTEELICNGCDTRCESCGRRFRFYTFDQVVQIRTSKYCTSDCQWEPTVAENFQRCAVCFDLRKTPASVPTA